MPRRFPQVLHSIAEQVGTPAYVYDARAIDAGIGRWIEAVGDPACISYAAKANTNLAVLARLERFGVGIEVATPGNWPEPGRRAFHCPESYLEESPSRPTQCGTGSVSASG